MWLIRYNLNERILSRVVQPDIHLTLLQNYVPNDILRSLLAFACNYKQSCANIQRLRRHFFCEIPIGKRFVK